MSLAIVTTSHKPDFPSFLRLHASVLEHTDPSTLHIVAVPEIDVPLFESIGSRRLRVVSERDTLPRRFVSVTRLTRIPRIPRGFRIAALNITRPWPPIRGWILQQMVKLAVVSQLEVDVALIIDSDVLLVRRVEESMFRDPDGVVRLYRLPDGITPDMTRHLAQRAKALQLLDLPGGEACSPDYIAGIVSWDPSLVRRMLARLETTTGRPWQDCVGQSLDFSEFITYGTYVMLLADADRRAFLGDRSLSHSHWGPTPLTMDAARRFVDMLAPEDLAIHVQSNTSTEESVLRYIAAEVARR
ncbi:DUF6492 family protein [Microbacterium cremeum]|uniref:DUF6492 family protein n=1 Tax=Microbacterium cremeum TaxID=2782169 RepID=UPI0018887882|nr:DUF6492 family protein [Microbacterium cremeum]